MKRFSIRVARKAAHISNRALHKATRLTEKVEGKATRILSGTDHSIVGEKTIPLEKLYYANLPHITPLNPALPAIGSEASVVLLLPSLDGKAFYGGAATALVVAGRLAQLHNRPLRIVQTLKQGNPGNLSEFFAQQGLEIPAKRISVISVVGRAYNVYGYLSMHPDDVLIASAWWDAYLISKLPLTRKFLYLVQDFEPIFYNNSDQYILAESTYKLDSFIPICNTRLMYDFMQDRKYPAFLSRDATWFEPAVSQLKSGSSVQKKNGEKRRLFLYGRPDVHRNLFFTALNAIDYALKAGFIDASEWEFYMAGQDNVADIRLSSGVEVKNLGKMKMEKYVAFSKTVDLAVSPMMAPHPNYPTLELASIGAAVVTTKYANKQSLTNYSKNIIASEIDIESIAGAIKEAALKSYSDRHDNLSSNTISGDWTETLDPKLQALSKKLKI